MPIDPDEIKAILLDAGVQASDEVVTAEAKKLADRWNELLSELEEYGDGNGA